MKFRGTVVESFIENGWPGGSLVVDRDRLEFHTGYPDSGYGEPGTVERTDVAAVVVRTQRVVPFQRGTFIVIRLHDGRNFRKIFKPFRARAAVAGLQADGWPIEQGDSVGWASVANAPQP